MPQSEAGQAFRPDLHLLWSCGEPNLSRPTFSDVIQTLLVLVLRPGWCQCLPGAGPSYAVIQAISVGILRMCRCARPNYGTCSVRIAPPETYTQTNVLAEEV